MNGLAKRERERERERERGSTTRRLQHESLSNFFNKIFFKFDPCLSQVKWWERLLSPQQGKFTLTHLFLVFWSSIHWNSKAVNSLCCIKLNGINLSTKSGTIAEWVRASALSNSEWMVPNSNPLLSWGWSSLHWLLHRRPG